MGFRRLEMRDETRNAMSDICGTITAVYGIVPSFDDCRNFALSIDRQVLNGMRRAKGMTPDEWAKETAKQVISSECE